MSDGLLVGVRKAFKSLGDDTTLSRFVKIMGEGRKRSHRRQPRLPGMEAPYIRQGRTKFPKTVKSPAEITILSSGHNNVKIGNDVRKGKLRGYRIYVLSLEERKTCPSSCEHWQSCYGNNMPFAKRIDHTHPEFLPKLEAEIAKLTKHGRGLLLRLHALGDFYSVEYVDFWATMLQRYPTLALYGYTARMPTDPIGYNVQSLHFAYGDRAMIRFSNGGLPTMSTLTIADETSRHDGAIICPEQTCRTRCCATCALCWTLEKNIAFLEH